jgi:polyketide biosynthesis enoyl-CoA hydratase PksH
MTPYQTLRIRTHGPVYTLQMYRPDANNTINGQLISEMHQALDEAARLEHTIVVIEGLPEVFCFGADFSAVNADDAERMFQDPEPLYELWNKLAAGPYITVAHVRGKVNAGGVGFVAASDIALADGSAKFSLSELLFGLIPACVMPFLVRRVGYQKAHYLTTMTQPINASQALACGLLDAQDEQSDSLLRKHLLPLRRLTRKTIVQYKAFMNEVKPLTQAAKDLALATNRQVFSDPQNIAAIERYVRCGIFPWDAEASHVE